MRTRKEILSDMQGVLDDLVIGGYPPVDQIDMLRDELEGYVEEYIVQLAANMSDEVLRVASEKVNHNDSLLLALINERGI